MFFTREHALRGRVKRRSQLGLPIGCRGDALTWHQRTRRVERVQSAVGRVDVKLGDREGSRNRVDAGEMSGATAMMALGKQVLKGQLLAYLGCTVETGVECTNPIAHA